MRDRSDQGRGEAKERFEDLKGKVLTVRDLSTYLRVHSSTIYRMLRKHQLPAFRIGSDWRFNVEAIDRWLAEAEARERASAGSDKSVPPRFGPMGPYRPRSSARE